MEKGSNYGKTGQYTKVIGEIIWLMGKEGLFIQMQMFMKENGKKIRLMDKVHTLMLMVQSTLESGWMINKKAKVLKYGLMVLNMKANIFKVECLIIIFYLYYFKERNREKGSSIGLMDRNMMGNFLIIIYMGLGFILGLMEEISKESGKITKWMGKENLDGLVIINIFKFIIFNKFK